MDELEGEVMGELKGKTEVTVKMPTDEDKSYWVMNHDSDGNMIDAIRCDDLEGALMVADKFMNEKLIAGRH